MVVGFGFPATHDAVLSFLFSPEHAAFILPFAPNPRLRRFERPLLAESLLRQLPNSLRRPRRSARFARGTRLALLVELARDHRRVLVRGLSSQLGGGLVRATHSVRAPAVAVMVHRMRKLVEARRGCGSVHFLHRAQSGIY